MAEAPEEAAGSGSLFQLCARSVSANMALLEGDVWGLPAVILQSLLPLLNIYYLERIETPVLRRGLSTQPVWQKLWNDIMKNKPTRLMAVPCWRKKFLETFFHSVLRGTLDVSCDWRLSDPSFSPLVHSARHVSEFTIFGKQQGVLELSPAVLCCLATSVESLKFLHMRVSDACTQRALTLLLHHLIHHGRVTKVSVLSWPRPDPRLLSLILRISAGYWQEVAGHPCTLCPTALDCPQPHSSAPDRGDTGGGHSALLSLQPLNISQNGAPEQPGAPGPSSASGDRPPVGPPSEPTDLYDFIFSVPLAEQSAEPRDEEDGDAGELVLQSASRLRSARALNLHNVLLTAGPCRTLCRLLRSWVSLERLTMAYIDIRSNVVALLEALSELAQDPRCRLAAFSMSDFSTHVGTLDLAQLLLRTFPGLQSLLLCYDLEESSDKVCLGAEPAPFTGNELRQLDLRFPHSPLDGARLVSALRASPCLEELSLDNAVFSQPEDVKRLLRTITDQNTALRRLSFHDLNLTEAQAELLHLLQHCGLEEIKLSFCRLLERAPRDFLQHFVSALKRNSTLKVLKLNGNRLGNKGLAALADIYTADSASSIHYLDVSSNCIHPLGLLTFARKLEAGGVGALRQLAITQNALDTDPATTHRALKILEGLCRVIKDGWDPAHAFADHISVM